MKNNLAKFANKLATGKWLINPTVHSKLCEQVEGYMKHPVPMESDTVQPNFVPSESPVDGGTFHGVVNIHGVLTKGPVSELEEQLLGLIDVDWVKEVLNMLAEDPSIKDIIICYDSPGGETTNIEETGRLIEYIDKNIKPVYSWTEAQADSAAFWLFTQGRMCGMSPSAQCGGCGVYVLVLDETQKMKNEGVYIDAIHSGRFKMMGHEFRSLTKEERQILLDDVTKQHEKFKAVVTAKRPKVSTDDLEGLSFNGEDALAKGFVDVLADSLDGFIATIDKSETTNMKPTVEKVAASPTSEGKAETMAKEEKPVTFMEALKKLMGVYDGDYQEAVPGVPGTEEEKKAEEKPADYTEKAQDHEEPDGDEMEECTCDKCGSKYKVKKGEKKAEEPEEPEEEENDDLPKHAEEPEAMPEEEKKAEGKYDGGYEAKKALSREDLMSACGISVPQKSEAQVKFEQAWKEMIAVSLPKE